MEKCFRWKLLGFEDETDPLDVNHPKSPPEEEEGNSEFWMSSAIFSHRFDFFLKNYATFVWNIFLTLTANDDFLHVLTMISKNVQNDVHVTRYCQGTRWYYWFSQIFIKNLSLITTLKNIRNIMMNFHYDTWYVYADIEDIAPKTKTLILWFHYWIYKSFNISSTILH